jgi:peptide deformylase
MKATGHPFHIHVVDKDTAVRQMSTPFDVSKILDSDSQTFFDQLIAAMIDFDGIGIASCQIGRTTQVVVIERAYVDDEYLIDDSHLVLINPRIVAASDRKTLREEGCLSVPGVFGPVPRSSKVRVKALLRNGETVDIKAKGMFAIILQHEVDHLHGRLFIDSAVSTHHNF